MGLRAIASKVDDTGKIKIKSKVNPDRFKSQKTDLFLHLFGGRVRFKNNFCETGRCGEMAWEIGGFPGLDG